jgi:hypothetical protein
MIECLKSLQIISGGQTGVDRAAMDFALENQIDCFGWCPKGRRAEDGPIPDKYPLKETPSEYYVERTLKNVEACEGVLVFVDKHPDKGTFLAIDYAEKLDKPIYVVHLSMNEEDQKIGLLRLMHAHQVKKLNIAGPRESNSPGINKQTKKFLEGLLK